MIFDRGDGLYIGQWFDGYYHGEGIYKQTDGVIYEGQWQKGLMHG